MSDETDAHEAVSDALRMFAIEMEHYVLAAGDAAALHRTDLTALSHAMETIHSGTRLTPGELAARMGLSPSATTSMLDRLEAAGHVVRSRESGDRRVVTITMTEKAQRTGYELFAPLAQAFEHVMAGYTRAELIRIQQFLNEISAATRSARPHAAAD